MAHSKQAKKRIRQNERRRLHNKSVASAMRTHIKKVLRAAGEGDLETARQILPKALSRIDKAAKIHVIHKNAAARKKSRLMRAVNAAGAAG